jgi:trimethylamine:corrinoid methyltransferase-like protein
LSTSYEKFILDIEMLQMFAESFSPWAQRRPISHRAVAEVGHAGTSSAAPTP